MTKGVSYYKLVCDYLGRGENPPVMLVGNLKQFLLTNDLTDSDRFGILWYVGSTCSGEEAYKFFKYLRNWGFLDELLPDISSLINCPQNKKNLKVTDALEHTLRVVRFSTGNAQMLLALYHDIGKIYTGNKNRKYQGHEVFSAIHAYSRFLAMGLEDVPATRYYFVIKNHMLPHNYQRRVKNKWTDQQVVDFVDGCGGLSNAIATIDLAIADKRASHNVDEYILPYSELAERCHAMSDDGRVKVIKPHVLCPVCMSRGDKTIERVLEKSALGFRCPTCNSYFRLTATGELVSLNLTYVDAEITGAYVMGVDKAKKEE